MSSNEHNAALMVQYLTWMKDVRHRQATTMYDYSTTLKRFLDWLGLRRLDAVTVEEMEEWVKRPRGGRSLGKPGAAATQAHDVAILKAFYKFMFARELVVVNPADLLVTPTVHNRNPRPIPDAHWRQLWDSDLTTYERVAFGLGFFCGLRRGEIVALTPAHIDITGRRLVGFVRKGGSDDVFPWGDVNDVFAESVDKLGDLGVASFEDVLVYAAKERVHNDYLIPWGEEVQATLYARTRALLEGDITDPNMVNRKMEAACRDAGTPKYTPHQLRHSFVTNLLRMGVPEHMVTRLANHTDPKVTARYSKVGGQELREWMSTQRRIA